MTSWGGDMLMYVKRHKSSFWLASLFGVLSSIGVALHGIGEVLQGNTSTPIGPIASWSFGPLFEHMDGDPGMTLIPNFLFTGIVALLIAVAMFVWSVKYLETKHGGLVLILLAVLALLFGGGGGPPTVGLFAGIGGLAIKSEHGRWRRFLGETGANLLATLWPWIFTLTLANGIFLHIGHILLVFVFGFTHPEPFVFSFLATPPLMVLSMIAGVGWDIRHPVERATVE